MKKILFIQLLTILTLGAFAQTDVTKYYLENYGFDENFDYKAGQTIAVAEEIKSVEGWEADLSAGYTIVGTYEFGFKGTFNTASVPAKGFDGEAGGGLAISTGWEQTFVFYQTVTLPAGNYTLKVPTYNGSTATAANSQVAWIPAEGTAVRSSVASYPAKAWTNDTITFTLSKTTTGKIQFGLKAAAGGSVNSAKLVVDYVKLAVENMAVDKSTLQLLIDTANGLYGDGSGNGAEALKQSIDDAKAVYENTDVTMTAVLDAQLALSAAIQVYREMNVSEENPLDKTAYIVNPSFEDGTKGWEVEELVSQSNTSFTKKKGAYYIEKWVSSGSVGNGSVRQTIKDLPNGIYKLTVGAQNLNQNATSAKNTGAYIFAGDMREPVYTPADYSVKFTSISGEMEIGFVAERAGGNWIAVDNFRLYLIGESDIATVLAEVGRIVEIAKQLQPSMMTATVATALQTAISAGETVKEDTPESDIQSIVRNLWEAIEQANVSIAQYQALSKKIADVEAAYDAELNEAESLKAEIDKAKELVVNAEATAEELAEQIIALDKALLAFHLANATPGTGAEPKVTFTHHYVATGATQALMRATSSGGNILERGVCWSNEHNPTVLDNRSTKSFSLKGTIFHITGLKPATVYYLRPYIMNKTYTVAYGDEVKIVTHPQGTCRGTWNEGAPDEAANARCRKAIQETIDYFNEWTGIKGFVLTGNYGAQTPTADCSYGGWMRIGPNAGNQAIGTVLHETGHGVGVGTHVRWKDCADTRENTSRGKWLGREANEVLRFLENYDGSEVFFTGDNTHGWGTSSNTSLTNATISYDWLVNGADKDTHQELQYIGGMCILHGLFIDGLCPTTNDPNGIAGYTYNFDDSKKYYLMNKNVDRGLGRGVLYQRSASLLAWKDNFAEGVLSDSAAWYMQFNPQTGHYMFKNVSTGNYLSHASGLTTKNQATPGSSERFQLMPDRTDVTIGVGTARIKTHGYWLTWYDGANKAVSANMLGTAGIGTVIQAAFNFSNSATAQQWIIICEDELEAYRAAIATGIHQVEMDAEPLGHSHEIQGIYTANGMPVNQIGKGVYIVKYADGSSKKIVSK